MPNPCSVSGWPPTASRCGSSTATMTITRRSQSIVDVRSRSPFETERLSPAWLSAQARRARLLPSEDQVRADENRALLADVVAATNPRLVIHGHWHHAHDTELAWIDRATTERTGGLTWASTNVVGLGSDGDDTHGSAVLDLDAAAATRRCRRRTAPAPADCPGDVLEQRVGVVLHCFEEVLTEPFDDLALLPAVRRRGRVGSAWCCTSRQSRHVLSSLPITSTRRRWLSDYRRRGDEHRPPGSRRPSATRPRRRVVQHAPNRAGW